MVGQVIKSKVDTIIRDAVFRVFPQNKAIDTDTIEEKIQQTFQRLSPDLSIPPDELINKIRSMARIAAERNHSHSNQKRNEYMKGPQKNQTNMQTNQDSTPNLQDHSIFIKKCKKIIRDLEDLEDESMFLFDYEDFKKPPAAPENFSGCFSKPPAAPENSSGCFSKPPETVATP
tara:strand:+ start:1411 stop:1932 length:522 start_codon:yes stop_codon:yes gene_type:complete